MDIKDRFKLGKVLPLLALVALLASAGVSQSSGVPESPDIEVHVNGEYIGLDDEDAGWIFTDEARDITTDDSTHFYIAGPKDRIDQAMWWLYEGQGELRGVSQIIDENYERIRADRNNKGFEPNIKCPGEYTLKLKAFGGPNGKSTGSKTLPIDVSEGESGVPPGCEGGGAVGPGGPSRTTAVVELYDSSSRDRKVKQFYEEQGGLFVDGSKSRAAGGRRIESYGWKIYKWADDQWKEYDTGEDEASWQANPADTSFLTFDKKKERIWKFELTVTDNEGGKDTSSAVVRSGPRRETTQYFTYARIKGDKDREVRIGKTETFEADTSNHKDGTRYTWAVVTPDGNEREIVSQQKGIGSEKVNFDYQFKQDGTYTIKLKVSSGASGQVADDAQDRVIVNVEGGPYADLKIQKRGENDVILDASGSTNGRRNPDPITTYTYTVFDQQKNQFVLVKNRKVGSVDSGVADKYLATFNSKGTYNVRLTVTDSGGDTDTVTETVNIGQRAQRENGAPHVKAGPHNQKPIELDLQGPDDGSEWGENYISVPGRGFLSVEQIKDACGDIRVESQWAGDRNTIDSGKLNPTRGYKVLVKDDCTVDIEISGSFDPQISSEIPEGDSWISVPYQARRNKVSGNCEGAIDTWILLERASKNNISSQAKLKPTQAYAVNSDGCKMGFEDCDGELKFGTQTIYANNGFTCGGRGGYVSDASDTGSGSGGGGFNGVSYNDGVGRALDITRDRDHEDDGRLDAKFRTGQGYEFRETGYIIESVAKLAQFTFNNYGKISKAFNGYSPKQRQQASSKMKIAARDGKLSQEEALEIQAETGVPSDVMREEFKTLSSNQEVTLDPKIKWGDEIRQQQTQQDLAQREDGGSEGGSGATVESGDQSGLGSDKTSIANDAREDYLKTKGYGELFETKYGGEVTRESYLSSKGYSEIYNNRGGIEEDTKEDYTNKQGFDLTYEGFLRREGYGNLVDNQGGAGDTGQTTAGGPDQEGTDTEQDNQQTDNDDRVTNSDPWRRKGQSGSWGQVGEE